MYRENPGSNEDEIRMNALLSDKALKVLAVLMFAAVSIALYWGLPLSSSLWLDETITAWIARAPLEILLERVAAYQGQSPLYFFCASLFVKSFGFSEFVLRAPSLLAGLVTLLLLYRLSRHYFSVSASIFSVMVMLAQSEFVRALVSARPYMMALLFLLVTLLLLARWQRDRQGITLICAAMSFLVAFYLHYLLAVSLFPLIIAQILSSLQKLRKNTCRTILFIVAYTLLSLPGVLQIAELSERLPIYSFAPAVSVSTFFKVLVPLEICVLFVTTFLLLFFFLPKGSCRVGRYSSTLCIFIISLTTIPILSLLIISLSTGESLLLGRYGLAATIGVALLGAWLLDCLELQRTKWWGVVFLGALLLINVRTWHHEDWRTSLTAIQAGQKTSSLILLYTGLSESQSAHWLMNDVAHEYLTTPVQIYAHGYAVLPIPRKVSELEFQEYLKTVVLPAVELKQNIYLIALRSSLEVREKKPSSVIISFQQLLQDRGFQRSSSTEELVSSVEFHR